MILILTNTNCDFSKIPLLKMKPYYFPWANCVFKQCGCPSEIDGRVVLVVEPKCPTALQLRSLNHGKFKGTVKTKPRAMILLGSFLFKVLHNNFVPWFRSEMGPLVSYEQCQWTSQEYSKLFYKVLWIELVNIAVVYGSFSFKEGWNYLQQRKKVSYILLLWVWTTMK